MNSIIELRYIESPVVIVVADTNLVGARTDLRYGSEIIGVIPLLNLVELVSYILDDHVRKAQKIIVRCSPPFDNLLPGSDYAHYTKFYINQKVAMLPCWYKSIPKMSIVQCSTHSIMDLLETEMKAGGTAAMRGGCGMWTMAGRRAPQGLWCLLPSRNEDST